jgi:hypothetical protein
MENNNKLSNEEFKKFWESLEADADIVDIISSYIDIKKKGKDWKCKCPFHNEKSDSFNVDRGKQIYKCFGCGESGTALTFIMKYENVDWVKAVHILAAKMQRSLPNAAPLAKPDIKQRDSTPEEKDGTWSFDYGEFTEVELTNIFALNVINYVKEKADLEKKNNPKKEVLGWKERLIAICNKYSFYKLNSYSINSKGEKGRKHTTIISNDNYPIFVWEMDGDIKKIYQPKSENKGNRFMYYPPTSTKDYLFGVKQCNDEYDRLNKDNAEPEFDEDGTEVKKPQTKIPEIIMASGGSDALNLIALDFFCIWGNSETAKLDGSKYNSISKLCEKFMVLPDIDATGKRAAHELCMFYLDTYTICLPESLLTKKDNRGYKCKDVRDYFRYYTAKEFKELVKAALPYRFWSMVPEMDKKGKPKGFAYHPINTNLYWFLKQNGFHTLVKKNKTEIYIHIQGNVVKEVEPKDIKRFVNDFLENRIEDVKLRDVFYKTTQVSSTSLENLKPIQVKFKDFSKTSQILFFDNAVWEVKANEVKEYKPGIIQNYVWNENIIKQKVKLVPELFTITYNDETIDYTITINNKECMFLNFLEKTCKMFWKKEEDYLATHNTLEGFEFTPSEHREQQLHLVNRITALGYLLHKYKEPSSAFIVWAMENEIIQDGNSEGRSGKSIMMKFPKYFMESQVLAARDPGFFDNKHWNENITEFTKYVMFDDCNEYFKTDILFPLVTGGLTLNVKNVKSTTLEEEDSPKYGVSSNYSPKKTDGSTLDRLWFTVFSDYYHGAGSKHLERRTPKDDFGLNLFTDFDEEQWNLALNFGALCIKAYLKFGKVNPPMANVRQRQLLGKMGDSFKNWADVYFNKESNRLDCRVNKGDAFDSCKKETNNMKLSAQGFKTHLKTFCEYYGYLFNPTNECTQDDKIIINNEGKTTEMIFIKTSNNIQLNLLEQPKAGPGQWTTADGNVVDDLNF